MHHSLSVELAALARELHSDLDVTQTLHTLLLHAPTLTGCERASVMLGDERPMEVASSTDTQAHKADLLQVEFGEGPGLTAMSGHEPVVITDISADTRWRRWAPEVTQLGFNGALSVRLGTRASTLGALSLYSPDPGWFQPNHVAAANLYARLASVAVASTQRISVMRRAVDDRTVIAEAENILQERYEVDAERAFVLLQRYAKRSRLELSDAAEDVIAARGVPQD